MARSPRVIQQPTPSPSNVYTKKGTVEQSRDRNVRFQGETAEERNTLPKNFAKTPHLPLQGLTLTMQDDMITTAVEFHMRRGVTNERRLKSMLGLGDVRRIRSSIEKVKNRWFVMGSSRSHASAKGEILARYETLQRTTWQIVDDPQETTVNRLSAIRTLDQLNRMVAELQGLKAAAAVVQVNNFMRANDKEHAIVESIAQRKRVHAMAGEFVKVLESNHEERIATDKIAQCDIEDESTPPTNKTQ